MKRTLSLLLALLLLLTLAPAALAFEDIPDFAERAAAESLASLGVVDSVDLFYPQSSLTRAQFCKIAVLAAGFEEKGLYSNYTIYPDVPAGAWYAPYVNAAVRKYNIIKGDERGRFNPDAAISYGECVTILLRILGYTTADVGMMWPTDYVNKAQSIGLNAGMKQYGAREAVSRGQAAILMCNTLLHDTKDGALYAAQGHSVGTMDTILLSTTETNPTLSASQAVLYLGGDSRTYATTGPVSSVLCGLRGLPVFEQRSQSRLKGFIANVGGASLETVVSATSTAINTKSGRINVGRDVPTMAGGSIGSYITHWFDLKEGDEISLYYNENGELELIAAHTQAAVSLGASAVYGVDAVSFRTGAAIVKNGAPCKESDLREYDVVSYSAANNTYYVSDSRVTLVYQSGSPVYANPSTITAGNRTFRVSESAGKYFSKSGIKLGSKMTLLFDYSGELAAVLPTKTLQAKAVGVLTSVSETSCTVDLLCGIKLEGTPSLKGVGSVAMGGQRVSGIYKLDGQLVEVSQNTDGLFELKAVSPKDVKDDYDVKASTLGKRTVAPGVKLYECCRAGMALHQIAVDDIPASKVDASKVLHYETNSAGQVDLMVLEDVTGDRYVYGMISRKTGSVSVGTNLDGEEITADSYEYTIRTAKGTLTCSTVMESPDFRATGTAYVPAAISADLVGDGARAHNNSAPIFSLTKTATVKRDAFDAYQGVKVGINWIDVADDVVIYSSSTNTFSPSLSEARANFTSFTLYLDRPYEEGGTVRVIVAD